MDDALVPTRLDVSDLLKVVLILVLMDDALVPCEDFSNLMRCTSLNPCFNG